tara:strand:- start:674 stop:856 length:183 start_codon:yes stop_codon:yes gene_type:complete
MEYITENWSDILSAVTSIVGGFAILATLTPNDSDNKFFDALMKAINTLGGNFGNAKNEEY